LLVRTDFDDDDAWLELRAAVEEPNADGFMANLEPVDDRAWRGADWTALRDAATAAGQHAEVLFVVDSPALGPGYPVQVVDLADEARPPFRCLASQLWAVDNNLNLANMDWDEFADALDQDGVFCGFD
jgi:hypothetical protein